MAMITTEMYQDRQSTSRKIVRDPGVLGGRWHFEGTQVAVAEVRADRAAHSDLDGGYHFAGLTEAEIVAAMNFEFPALRETAVQVDYMAVTVHCTCGEETHKTMIGPSHTVDCACDRHWRITVMGDDTAA